MSDDPARPNLHISKHRLEALVDGVFAIAMTILILEVKVPALEAPHSGAELARRLAHDLPTLAAYFFSFGLLGIFWAWHHRLARFIASLDVPLLALSLFFLSLVSFFPFAAALVGRYFTNPVSMAVYFPTTGLILATQWMTLEVARRRGRLDPEVPAAEILAARTRNGRGLAIFALANIPNALRLGWIPLGLTFGLGVAFLVWTRRLR
ncbi:MAG: TMEM175 family protein [Holophagaceae bacterium]